MSRIIINGNNHLRTIVRRISEQVEFDRVTDKPFCACMSGSLNTTQKDEHDHIVPEDLYPKFMESMKWYPERRILSLYHDRDDLVGEILWADIRDDGEDIHLVGGIGIYEEVSDRLEEKEDLGGFSVSLIGYENIDAGDWNPNEELYSDARRRGIVSV